MTNILEGVGLVGCIVFMAVFLCIIAVIASLIHDERNKP